jgi:hypothetical protein
MAVSSIRHAPPYQAPAHAPPKPEQKPKAEEYWKAKPSAPPKKHNTHKVDVSV